MAPSESFPASIGNWWLGERLGSGFSGSIFRGTNVHSGQVCALKLQLVDHECPTNRYERSFYPALQGGIGMPTLWAAGVVGKYDYLAIDLLGRSLDSLYRENGKKVMDLRSVCCIAMQVISRLEHMHNRGILHRDIQLGNCVVGLEPNEQTLYMIDFGFSKRYIDPNTNRHIPDSRVKRDFIGNYWFSSVGVHCRGRVPSRRDDLEAVALMLIHLLTPGGLSWTRNGVPKTDDAHERLKREKRDARPEDLCNGLPPEFEEFLRYCRRLKFAECPDYAHWREEFMGLAEESGFPATDAFVWPPDPRTCVYVTARAAQPEPVVPAQVEAILNDLAKLQLAERPVLGNRNDLANGVRPAEQAQRDDKKLKPKPPNGVIVISDNSENEPRKAPAGPPLPKAAHLMRLSRSVTNATDNVALADVVREFFEVLQSSRSRTLTREAFTFLDALYKQLADPSVFVQPIRNSQNRNIREVSEQSESDVRRLKKDKLYRLQRDVPFAPSNKDLATMVADFGAVIDRSKGRTVTKDALGFLERLAARLRAMP